jgi:hypothetical protein
MFERITWRMVLEGVGYALAIYGTWWVLAKAGVLMFGPQI